MLFFVSQAGIKVLPAETYTLPGLTDLTTQQFVTATSTKF